MWKPIQNAVVPSTRKGWCYHFYTVLLISGANRNSFVLFPTSQTHFTWLADGSNIFGILATT